MRIHESTTAADLITEIGRILSDHTDDWQARLAVSLRVRRDTIRDWRTGRLELKPDHNVFDDLLSLLTRREEELRRARADLEAWMIRNRKEDRI
jgi:hypothetical protein